MKRRIRLANNYHKNARIGQIKYITNSVPSRFLTIGLSSPPEGGLEVFRGCLGVEVSVLTLVPRSPDIPKLIGVPGFVIPAPPAEIVVPVTANVVGLGENTSVPIVSVASQECPVVLARLAMLAILVPIFRIPDASRRIGVPAIVTPGLSAEIVVPAIGNAIQLGVKTWPPKLYAASCKSLLRIAVLLILIRLVPIFRIPELSD